MNKFRIAAVVGSLPMPGVLKNAIEPASQPCGSNAWVGKPAGFTGISIDAIGTDFLQERKRALLGFVQIHVNATALRKR